ncbi:hypothetical protein [Corynebacterium sp. AOP12-C2-36]|uniref:hypothetical protein n=1 Tax=Corynebacterium sp. AOP12-C2-36 TaxID=3457723 RepID=UPI004034203D
MVVPPRSGGMGAALDAHLIAAAPDLARTVIAQAEEIERIKTALIDHLRQEADGWVSTHNH